MRNTLFAGIILAAGMQANASDAPVDSLGGQRLGEIVVTGTRTPSNPALLSQTVSVVGRNAIENSLRPSLLPVLSEQIPGLFTTSRGVYGFGVSTGSAGGISIRGLSGGSAQVLTLIDGHPQYSGIFGHPISDALQGLMTEKVEVVRGPASTIYGSNAMGGVVNVITRRMTSDGVRTDLRAGYGSWNTLETEISNQLRIGKFSSTVSVSYNRSDNHRPDMEFSQTSGFARLGYDISRRWKAYADIDLTHFNGENPGPVSRPLTDSRQSITRGAAAAGMENHYDMTDGGLSVFFNWGHHWINDGYAAGASPRAYRFLSDDNMAGVSLWQSIRPFRGSTITLGADWFRYSGNAWNRFVEGPRTGEDQTIVDRSQNEFAGYIDVRQEIARRLTVSAGVRVDNNDGVGTEWIPKAGFALSLPREITLKGAVSKGFRYPTLREMYMFGAANPDLAPESLWNYEIALSQTLCDGALEYGINLFFIDADNIILTMPRTDGPGQLNVNSGKVVNKGVELRGAWRISPSWSVDANYSFVDMNNPVVAAPVHKLYAGGMFMKDGWSVSTGLQYIGKLYTSVSPEQTENVLLWNLRLQYRVNRWLSLWARGENLLARRYEINAGFPMPRATAMAGVHLSF